MTIYYYINESGNKIGSRNREKVVAMGDGKKIYQCDITDFDGHLMSNNWDG